MTRYYQCFIQDYAIIAEPLTNLTRKAEPDTVKWTVSTEQAFQTLKNKLTIATVMKCLDYSKTFVLLTDASQVGVGAVLSQGNDDYPIEYYSRKLLDREKRYSTIEQECLAIMLSIKAFEVYLIGKPFVLQTDHRALQWIQRC